MKQEWIGAARLAVPLIVGLLVINQSAYAQTDKPKIIHDAEYYMTDFTECTHPISTKGPT